MKIYRVETKTRRIGPFTGTNYYNTFGNRFMDSHFARFDQEFEDSCKDARYGVTSKTEMKRLLEPCLCWHEKGNKKDKRKIENFYVRVYNSDKFLKFPDGQIMFERKGVSFEKEWSVVDFIKEGK